MVQKNTMSVICLGNAYFCFAYYFCGLILYFYKNSIIFNTIQQHLISNVFFVYFFRNLTQTKRFLDICGRQLVKRVCFRPKKFDNSKVISLLTYSAINYLLILSLFFFFCIGLCHKNLNQEPGEKFATTDEDLQGFWDMVMLQVDHVDQLFREIEEYRANNWEVISDLIIL